MFRIWNSGPSTRDAVPPAFLTGSDKGEKCHGTPGRWHQNMKQTTDKGWDAVWRPGHTMLLDPGPRTTLLSKLEIPRGPPSRAIWRLGHASLLDPDPSTTLLNPRDTPMANRRRANRKVVTTGNKEEVDTLFQLLPLNERASTMSGILPPSKGLE
uniref:Uncharacterized protein n=1 Tax=Panagrellus redivivus TaxID=6233 RepID=A0A7E4UL31_PANRE